MPINRQINRSVWALADKSLPMLYGGVFALVVAQTMPAERLGNWITFQLMWMAATQLGDYFILQPMVKLAAEDRTKGGDVIGASTGMYLLFLVVVSALFWSGAPLIAMAFRAPALAALMPWMAAMLLSSFLRNVAIRTLQIDYSIERIFFVDAVFFFLVIGIIGAYAVQGVMDEPMRMVEANVVAGVVSSVAGVVAGWRTLSFRHASRAAASRVYTLGIYQAGTGALQIMQQQLDGVFLGLIRSQTEVAAYIVAKTYFRGFEAFRDAAGFVVLPAISEAHGRNDGKTVLRLTEAGLVVLLVLIVPLVVISVAGAHFLFTVIYQGKQDASAPLFQIFNIGALALPFTIIASNLLLGIGQTRPLYRITVANTVIFAVLFAPLTWMYGAVGAAGALTLTSFAYAAACTVGMRAVTPISVRGIRAHATEFAGVLRRLRRSE